MSGSGGRIAEAVGRAVRLVRRDAALAVLAAVLAVVPGALLVAWLWGPERWSLAGGGPLVLVLVALAGAGVLAWVLVRRWVAGVDDAAVAAAVERRQALPEGSVRGVLELGRQLSPGGSRALFERSELELDLRLTPAGSAELAGDLGERARGRRTRALAVLGSLVVVAGFAGFASPERARGAWAPLLSPVAHLRGPVLPPILVRPGDVQVERGGAVDLAVEAPLRNRVTLHWRATGDVPHRAPLPLEDGRITHRLGPVEAPIRYWVTAPDGASSDTFRLVPVDPLLVSALTIELTFPRYVGREPERYDGQAPPLTVPEGTRIRVEGQTTRPIQAARLRRADGLERPVEADGHSFSVDWRPAVEASGRWAWELTGTGGLSSLSAPLDLSVVEDAAPRVRLLVPGADTVMPASRKQLLVAEAADDHGLAGAELVYRTVGAGGTRGSELRQPIGLTGALDRALVRAVLDAEDLPLTAGDAVEYQIVVRDGSPGGQTGASGWYRLRLPGMDDLRDLAREEADGMREQAEALAERSRELEAATRDLSRRSAAGSAGGQPGGSAGRTSSGQERLDFEEASEARQILDRHEEVLSELEAIRARVEELEAAIEAAGLRDPQLEQRLAELRSLYEQLATPEMREQMEALREGVEALDPAAVQAALEQLAERQEELRRQVEESLDLMRRAAAEQELSALAQEAEEIAVQQEALARALADPRREAEANAPTNGANPDAGAERQQRPGDPEAGQQEAGQQEAGQQEAGQQEAGQQEPGQNATGPRPDSAAARPGAQQPERPETASDSAASDPGPSGAQQPTPTPPQLPQPQLPRKGAEQQEELERKAGELNRSMQQLQQQLMQIGEREAAQQTGAAQQKGESAQQSMQQAAQQARQQQGQQAGQSGQRAASQMGEAAQTLNRARQQMTEARREQAQEAVRQATQEALSMAQREEALRQQMQQAQQQGGAQGQSLQQMRSAQAALQQGLQQLGRNLSEAGEGSGSMSREVSEALSRAMLDMQRTMQSLQQDHGPMPVQQAGQTVEALNELAMQLLQRDAQMQQAQGGGAVQQAMEQLGRLAREQASLNGQTGALAPMDLSRQALRAQLQQMAERQRGIARRVGEASDLIGGREDVLGRVDQLASEAESIAEALAQGRLDPDVRARQERLFRRLLDAGRSLEREEYSEERVGERPGGVEVLSPEALDPALLEGALRYGLPSSEQLDALPPAYRRLILEYFDRLNRPAGAVERDGTADVNGADG